MRLWGYNVSLRKKSKAKVMVYDKKGRTQMRISVGNELLDCTTASTRDGWSTEMQLKNGGDSIQLKHGAYQRMMKIK